MASITNAIAYVFLFFSLYFEVFLVMTYFEKRAIIKEEEKQSLLPDNKLPKVSIIVPCFNEEKTIDKTIESLLGLIYPKDKLEILIVDDGSKDKTWEVAQKYSGDKNIRIFKKENGGKYTALNFGIERSTGELVGCLDADSFVDPIALQKMIPYFSDKEIMAVTPAIRVHEPKGIIQLMQKMEYIWGIFFRKMVSSIGALHVTPGPFSIFRRSVFRELGMYRHAHNTEDMEMAMRLQKNHYKIVNSHRSYVYTVAPNTVKKLYKQKLRWTYGFLKNALDYKEMILNKKYGNLGFLIMPLGIISVFSALYFFGSILVRFGLRIWQWYIHVSLIGFNLNIPTLHFDWFYLNTEVISMLSLSIMVLTFTIIFIARKFSDGKFRLGMDIVYFLILYSILAPLWLAKSLFNLVFSVKTSWR